MNEVSVWSCRPHLNPPTLNPWENLLYTLFLIINIHLSGKKIQVFLYWWIWQGIYFLLESNISKTSVKDRHLFWSVWILRHGPSWGASPIPPEWNQEKVQIRREVGRSTNPSAPSTAVHATTGGPPSQMYGP